PPRAPPFPYTTLFRSVVTKLVPPYTVNWDSTRVASGTYTLTARAWDAAHNSTVSNSTTVTIDNTPPDTSIDSAPAAQTGATTARSEEHTSELQSHLNL